MSNHLYNARRSTRDEFRLDINDAERGEVVVTFVNGRFSEARFPFTGPYTRNGWRILSAIDAFISEKERELAAEYAVVREAFSTVIPKTP